MFHSEDTAAVLPEQESLVMSSLIPQCNGRDYEMTDLVDGVTVQSSRVRSRQTCWDIGWFTGPVYAIGYTVFYAV